MKTTWSCPACGDDFYRQYGDRLFWCAICEHGFEIRDLGSLPLGLGDDLFKEANR